MVYIRGTNPIKEYLTITTMKMTQLFSLVAATVLWAVSTQKINAADSKEVTLTGNAVCAKCALHETDACQSVIQKTEHGKTVNYYLAKNDVSKEFHDNVCKESKQVSAKGTVKEVDGKKVLTASNIELVK